METIKKEIKGILETETEDYVTYNLRGENLPHFLKWIDCKKKVRLTFELPNGERFTCICEVDKK